MVDTGKNPKCDYCESTEVAVGLCGHLACQEHMYFIRNVNRLEPYCIHCYEESRQANFP